MVRRTPREPSTLLGAGHVVLGHGNPESSCFNVSCRNKVIWVGIASQIAIALILSYGLGSIKALNFTMLR